MLAVEAGAQSDSRKGLVKNVFSLGVVQVANYAIPFFTVPIVSRIIGPDKFGVINFAAAFAAYFTLLINFGFDLTATRAIAANRHDVEQRNRIFNQVTLAKVLLFGVSLIVFIICLFTIPELRNEKPVAVFSFLLTACWVITPNWLFTGMQDLSRVAVFNLVTKVLFTVLILVVVREKSDYIWQPLAVTIAQMIVAVVSFVYAIRRYRIHLYVPSLQPVLRLLWSERIIFFSMVVINLYTTTNVVLLGFLETDEQVGYYTAAWRIIIVMQSVIAMPLSQSLFPFVGAAFSQSKEKGLQVVRQLLPIVTLITGAAAVFLWLFGPFIILLLYGKAFSPAVVAFRVLAFVPLAVGWNTLLGIQTMVNLKMDKAFFRITAVGALLSIALNFLLVSRFGFMGTAWSWLVTEVLITTSMLLVLRRERIRLFDRRYFTPTHFKQYLNPLIVRIKEKLNR